MILLIVHLATNHAYALCWDTIQDFLIKLGIKPCLHVLKISIFSLNHVIIRPIKKTPQSLQNSYFQSHFLTYAYFQLMPSLIKKSWTLSKFMLPCLLGPERKSSNNLGLVSHATNVINKMRKMVHTGRFDFKFFQHSKFTLKYDKPNNPSHTSVLHNFWALMISMSSKLLEFCDKTFSRKSNHYFIKKIFFCFRHHIKMVPWLLTWSITVVIIQNSCQKIYLKFSQ